MSVTMNDMSQQMAKGEMDSAMTKKMQERLDAIDRVIENMERV